MSVSRLPVVDAPARACAPRCWREEPHACSLALPGRIEVGPLVIDRRMVDVTFAGAPLYVTPTEYRLLVALAERPGTVISHWELIRQVWGDHITGTPDDLHNLSVHVNRIRRRLDGASWLIGTRTGFGYFLRPVKPIDAPAPRPVRIEYQHRPVDHRTPAQQLGRRQRRLLALLRRTPGQRVTVARAVAEAYGYNTNLTRTRIRVSARRFAPTGIDVRECWGPPPGGGWIWIEEPEP